MTYVRVTSCCLYAFNACYKLDITLISCRVHHENHFCQPAELEYIHPLISGIGKGDVVKVRIAYHQEKHFAM